MSIPTPQTQSKPTLSVSEFLLPQKKEEVKEQKKEKGREEKKDKYADSLVIQLPKGEKAKVKSFCALHGISLTDFVYYSMEYIIAETEQGNKTVSKYGIKENLQKS